MSNDNKTAQAIRDVALADQFKNYPPGFMHDATQLTLRSGSVGIGFAGAIGTAIHNWFASRNDKSNFKQR